MMKQKHAEPKLFFFHYDIMMIIRRRIYFYKTLEFTGSIFKMVKMFDWLCMPWCASRTDCIALYVDRTAGSQTSV